VVSPWKKNPLRRWKSSRVANDRGLRLCNRTILGLGGTSPPLVGTVSGSDERNAVYLAGPYPGSLGWFSLTTPRGILVAFTSAARMGLRGGTEAKFWRHGTAPRRPRRPPGTGAWSALEDVLVERKFVGNILQEWPGHGGAHLTLFVRLGGRMGVSRRWYLRGLFCLSLSSARAGEEKNARRSKEKAAEAAGWPAGSDSGLAVGCGSTDGSPAPPKKRSGWCGFEGRALDLQVPSPVGRSKLGAT